MGLKINKTNALRLLDKAGIKYDTQSYEPDENNLEATHIARQVGVSPDIVFKTLLLRGDKNGVFVCIIPANCEVDLKKAAVVSGNKKAVMLPLKELLPTTGYIRGGCSPIGMKKQFPTYIHHTAAQYDAIYVSAGVRGVQVILSPNDLVSVTGAAFEDLV